MSEIKAKPCNRNCGTIIYWDTDANYYREFESRQRHFCPNFVKGEKPKTQPSTKDSGTGTIDQYANSTRKEKEKTENSMQFIVGVVPEVMKKYEQLSDLIIMTGGKVHGSQSHVFSATDISVTVYYEVPVGNREKIKQLFKEMTDKSA